MGKRAGKGWNSEGMSVEKTVEKGEERVKNAEMVLQKRLKKGLKMVDNGLKRLKRMEKRLKK